jgi:hypothetical protein
MAVWGWAGLVFAVLVALGLLPDGVDRPIAPDTLAATEWPLAALAVLGGDSLTDFAIALLIGLVLLDQVPTAAAVVGIGFVVAAGVGAEQVERLVDGDAQALREAALGLFDDDATVQRPLQLLGEDLATADRSFLQEPDRRDVGQGLHDPDVGRCDGAYVGAEQVERSEPFGP